MDTSTWIVIIIAVVAPSVAFLMWFTWRELNGRGDDGDAPDGDGSTAPTSPTATPPLEDR